MSPFRKLAGQGGYSLIEMMVVVGMAGITIGAISRFAFRSRLDLLRQEGQAELYSRNTRIGMNLRSTLQTSELALVNYGGSPDYTALRTLVKASVAAGGAPTPATFSSPPVVTSIHQPYLTGTAGVAGGTPGI
jgi:prepilin-type N-terminal cleavage/methylation domain-containing protein